MLVAEGKENEVRAQCGNAGSTHSPTHSLTHTKKDTHAMPHALSPMLSPIVCWEGHISSQETHRRHA